MYKKKIGVYGGTFDPPTKSHLEIIRQLIKQNLVDEVWVTPCGERKDKFTLTSPEQRLQMIQLSINESFGQIEKERIKICRIEVENIQTIPTYYLLEKLKQFNPDYEFYFVLGYDLVPGLIKWENGPKLIQENQFILVSQPEFNWEQFQDFLPPKHLKMEIKVDVRSTNYRKIIPRIFRDDKKQLYDLDLPESVIDFILQNNIFIEA